MRYFLSLGSNLGDKRRNLLRALNALKRGKVELIRASSIYHTQPVGTPPQPWFYNQVIEVDTGFSPGRLLSLAKKVERELGRRAGPKSGPRTIDIDILLAGDRIIASKKLIIPHPRMAERNFVLIPLKEIAPQAVHPVLGVEIKTLARRSNDRSIVRKVQIRPSRKRPLNASMHG
jgi:2-amino-4-hydroxy-6-hydroxymethyldihydropteridine diphosphokinase